MYLKMMLWLFAITTCLAGYGQSFDFNMTQYYKMPKLYDFDDYDRCLQEYNEVSTYCFVRVEVVPQNTSEAWQAIADVSKNWKQHFDHQQLYYGICLRWCEAALAELDGEAERNELYAGILSDNAKINAYLNLMTAEEPHRKRYNRLMNQCVNLRLGTKHNLTARSVIEYCDTNKDTVEEDAWNTLFYLVFFLLIFLVTVSSSFDFYLKHKQNDKLLTSRDHYKTAPTGLVKKFFVMFSMTRNWYRLIQEPNSKLARDLRFLDCFKFFAMFLVIFAHTNWVLYEGAIDNPQDPERLLHTLAGSLLTSGSLITVTFFVISGLLLTLNWIDEIKNEEELSFFRYIGIFIRFNVFRYIRLTVPYAFLVLLSGVYFQNADGPLWRHIFEYQQLSCRKNWWTNMLYINNFVNTNEKCMLQTWYLAADAQAFIVCLVILMLAHKWPKIRNCLFGFVIFLSLLFPGLAVYRKGFYPMFLPSLQIQRDSFIEDTQFTEFYAPMEMNFGTYFFGAIAGLLYHQVSKTQFKLRSYKSFQIVWYALFPFGVGWLLVTHFILQSDVGDTPTLWGSIFAALQRNVWGFGSAMLILGMASKVGWIFREFSCFPAFRVLGRLTYCAFVGHLWITHLVLGTIRQPIHFGTGTMFAFVVFNMASSYAFSLIVVFLVELPVSAFLKIIRQIL